MPMTQDDIPLTAVRTNSSSRNTRKPTGLSSMSFGKLPTIHSDDEKKGGFFNRGGPAGRRRIKRIDSKNSSGSARDREDQSLNSMGRLYYMIINSNPVTRYLVYVLPVAAIIAIPLAIFATVGHDDMIGGVRAFWFVLWLLIVWLGIWVSKIFAKAFPGLFMFLCGVVSSGTRKYALVIKNLEVPISLIGWAAVSFATFEVLTTRPDNGPHVGAWVGIMKQILAALLISAGLYTAEKVLVQMISISYHARSFENRIKESKHMVWLLGLLFNASRTLFPMYCREFQEEDYLITGNIEIAIAEMKGHARSGSATPMRILGEINRLGDKFTSAFGNIASEIAGKQVFNPNSAHSIVIEALEKKKSTEALAKRIWMSFVVEGKEALYAEDLREVLGPSRQEEADEAFAAIDADNNGDVSLDEMIMKVVEIGRDRKAIANSMNDIGQAIAVLDSVLVAIVFVICVLVFVAFLNTSFVTTLATAGTTLLSLSFVFAVTTQEFLGSCIFLFVKHPYDVGDRVDIVGPEKEQLVVEQISLLYTVFKRIDCMKMVQVPNIVLNTMWIENVTRSKAMKEQLDMFISFDTTLEDIELLRTEMEKFVRDPENSRDFQPDLVLECTGVGNMDKLQLRVEIRHKSNWSNETVRAARRSKFMCALVLALRKVPIYAPGGGGAPLGDPSNPSYSVAVSDDFAVGARDKAAKAKEDVRLVPSKKKSFQSTSNDSGKSTAVDDGKLGSNTENEAIEALNSRRPTEDVRDDWGSRDNESIDESLERTRSRNKDLENLRQGLLKRESTRGRRRPGVAIPPSQPGFPEPLSATTSARGGLDEEAMLGVGQESRMYPAQSQPNPQPASYSAFPPVDHTNNFRLQPLPSAPPGSQPSRARGLSGTEQIRRA